MINWELTSTGLMNKRLKAEELCMTEDLKWCFYDPESKMKTDVLSTDEAQMVILKMRVRDMNKFYVWRADWSAWKPLNQFMSSAKSPFSSLTMLTAIPTPAPHEPVVNPKIKMISVDLETQAEIEKTFSNVSLGENSDETVTVATPNFKNIAKTNSSKNDGQKIELVLMTKKGHVLRSIAKDISLSGSYCEKYIPSEFHENNFEVVIINTLSKDPHISKLKLNAQITIVKNSPFVQFVFKKDEEKNLLNQSLSFYLRELEKIKAG